VGSETVHQEAESAYQEIMYVVPFYADLTYERLLDCGLQWPYHAETEAGTAMFTLDMLKTPLEFAIDR
jgi:predicted molibdopterin-dependent oxidoreductase YjgC